MEKGLYNQSIQYIAGVDEVGRGAWAGPLVAAAVIMPRKRIKGVMDSKQLTHRQREQLFPKIIQSAVCWSVVSITQRELDAFGLHKTNIFALSYALTHLDIEPNLALIDGFALNHYIPTQRVVGGDRKSYNIAAASIIAKVVRDQMMEWADTIEGRYAFAQHKGYGTPQHKKYLIEFGPSDWHRKTFAPVQRMLYT